MIYTCYAPELYQLKQLAIDRCRRKPILCFNCGKWSANAGT